LGSNFFFTVRIDLQLQIQLQVHKKLFHHTKYPDFDPSSSAAISTWEAETWYELLCRIDLEPHFFKAPTDSIYEIRSIVLDIDIDLMFASARCQQSRAHNSAKQSAR